jgi:hypothetical protein
VIEPAEAARGRHAPNGSLSKRDRLLRFERLHIPLRALWEAAYGTHWVGIQFAVRYKTKYEARRYAEKIAADELRYYRINALARLGQFSSISTTTTLNSLVSILEEYV